MLNIEHRITNAEVRHRSRSIIGVGVAIGIGIERTKNGLWHEKLDGYRAAIEYVGWAHRFCENLKGHRIMRTRHSTRRKSIPIPIPTPTPMGTWNKRIANHCPEATTKGAPQAHDRIHSFEIQYSLFDILRFKNISKCPRHFVLD